MGVKVGRLANQDDTIFTLYSSFHCDSCRNNCPYRYFYKEYITKHNFCRIAHRIFMVVLWLYMVGFYYFYGVPFLSYLSGCYESFSFSTCYPDSLQLLPTLMQYSPIYSIIKLLAHFNIEITLRLSFLLFGCV